MTYCINFFVFKLQYLCSKIIPAEVMYFVLEVPVNRPPDVGVLSGEVLLQPQTDPFSGCHRD